MFNFIKAVFCVRKAVFEVTEHNGDKAQIKVKFHGQFNLNDAIGYARPLCREAGIYPAAWDFLRIE